MNRVFLIFLSLLAVASLAVAQLPCRTYQQEQIVATPAVVYLPAYYAQFTGPATPSDVQTGPQQPQPQAAKPAEPPAMPPVNPPSPLVPDKPLTDSEVLRALLEEIRALRADLKRLEGQAANPQAAPGGNLADRVGPIVSHSCNQCHNAAVSDAKGGGLILVDAQGIVVQLDKANKKRVAARLQLSQMPPANAPATARLTDAERKDLLEWFKP